jgi:iron(III) transport system permease protein
MPRPVALPAFPASPIDLVRAAGVVAALLLPTVFIAGPVSAVVVRALFAPAAWPWRVALETLVVALAATLAASAPALLIAFALTRVDLPGRTTVWQIFRLGVLIPPFIVPISLLALGGPHGLLASSPLRGGLAAIAIGQALAFLPYAVVLQVRALASVPAELEQAAEVLGARPVVILRRVTLALAGPGVIRAALLVLGLCLADVTAPLLLGGDAQVLTTVIVAAAALDPAGAAGAALTLAALAVMVTSAAAPWRPGAADPAVLGRLERPVPPAVRWLIGLAAWAVTAGLAGLWAMVPLASLLQTGGPGVTLEHWAVLATPAAGGALRNSVLLGLGIAVTGTALALVTAWAVERRRTWVGRTLELLARLPLAVPGVVAGVGYLLVFATPAAAAGTLLALVAVVACWELPVTSRAARDVLVRTDRSAEDAAVNLGASGLTTLTRVVAPALRPAAGWIFGYLLAAGVLAVGTVIVLTGSGRALGALTMLTLAAAGATGPACAVATALLALAGGAVLLGRAIAGHQRGPVPLA